MGRRPLSVVGRGSWVVVRCPSSRPSSVVVAVAVMVVVVVVKVVVVVVVVVVAVAVLFVLKNVGNNDCDDN